MQHNKQHKPGWCRAQERVVFGSPEKALSWACSSCGRAHSFLGLLDLGQPGPLQTEPGLLHASLIHLWGPLTRTASPSGRGKDRESLIMQELLEPLIASDLQHLIGQRKSHIQG